MSCATRSPCFTLRWVKESVRSVLCWAMYGQTVWCARKAPYLEVGVAVVEQNNPHVAAVVVINNPRPDVDEVFPGQTRPRRDCQVSLVLGDVWANSLVCQESPVPRSRRRRG